MVNGIQDTFNLSNGVEIPMIGLGVWLATDRDELMKAIKISFNAGYRLVDTAAQYGNEGAVGQGIKESGLKRDELFVTTKMLTYDQGQSREWQLRKFDESLKRLQMDYVDLYLIHWPVNADDLFVSAWETMIEIYKSGKAKSIGVSNFKIHHIEKIVEKTGFVPMVNQTEVHPWVTEKELLAYCAKNGILLQAYSPIMHGRLSEEPGLLKLAEKYKRTAAQVVLRWHLQNGLAIIPKSVRKERILENCALYDFALDDEDVLFIDSLNKNTRFLPDPDIFNRGVNLEDDLYRKTPDVVQI